MLNQETFLELARTWKYCGLPENIEFTLLRPTLDKEDWIKRVRFMLAEFPLAEVEGYFAATLMEAEVPNVIKYTLSGGRTHG